MTLQQEIEALGPWFHNLHLPDGTQTLPTHPLIWGDFPAYKWAFVADTIPADLTGWRVLDIGCNAGFYTFELAKRGATVLGIDVDERYLTQARWAADKMGLADRTEFRRMQVYDLARLDDSFDLVWFMGVFYHLRYPVLGLDIVAQKVRRRLVFQTLTTPGAEIDQTPPDLDILKMEPMRSVGWPRLSFIENRLANDPTNWFTPNLAGVEALLRSAGMRITHRAKEEIYICEPDPENPNCVSTWNRSELLAATGKPHD